MERQLICHPFSEQTCLNIEDYPLLNKSKRCFFRCKNDYQWLLVDKKYPLTTIGMCNEHKKEHNNMNLKEDGDSYLFVEEK
jgi:hypothetical protein